MDSLNTLASGLLQSAVRERKPMLATFLREAQRTLPRSQRVPALRVLSEALQTAWLEAWKRDFAARAIALERVEFEVEYLDQHDHTYAPHPASFTLISGTLRLTLSGGEEDFFFSPRGAELRDLSRLRDVTGLELSRPEELQAFLDELNQWCLTLYRFNGCQRDPLTDRLRFVVSL
jgi:hypothetical protein